MDDNKNFIALRNVNLLIKEIGGRKEFAAKTGIDITYLSLLMNERRKFGPVIATKIEQAFNKSDGWLYKL